MLWCRSCQEQWDLGQYLVSGQVYRIICQCNWLLLWGLWEESICNGGSGSCTFCVVIKWFGTDKTGCHTHTCFPTRPSTLCLLTSFSTSALVPRNFLNTMHIVGQVAMWQSSGIGICLETCPRHWNLPGTLSKTLVNFFWLNLILLIWTHDDRDTPRPPHFL